jgi:hypothetical protein
MIDWFILYILISEIIILSIIDKIIYGTWITPFTLIGVPYTLVSITAFFFGPVLGFITLYVESIIIWEIGLFLFFLGGLLVALLLLKPLRSRNRTDRQFLYEKKSDRWALLLAWMTIFVMAYGLYNSIKSLGWQQIATDEFGELYGYGWVGHFRNFSMGITIFLIGTVNRRHKFKIFTILILIALYVMYPVKSWIAIPILAGFIYRFSCGRLNPSFSKLALLLLFGFGFFNLSYLISFGVQDFNSAHTIEMLEFIVKHFVSYLFSGVLALSNVVQTGLSNLEYNPRVIFAPFLNLYAIIFSGELINNVSDHFSEISPYLNKTSNVHTFFGTILINLGLFSSIVYVIFSSFFIYGIFAAAKVTRNCWIQVVWVLIGSMLSFGWFEFYLWHLPAIEVPVYCFFLGILSWLVRPTYQTKYSGSSEYLHRRQTN